MVGRAEIVYPCIAVGVCESERYPSRKLWWYGYPKLMGDVARSLTSPPVTGAGEPEREMNGLKAGAAGGSLLPSINGDAEDELEELLETEALSCVPSVLLPGWD